MILLPLDHVLCPSAHTDLLILKEGVCLFVSAADGALPGSAWRPPAVLREHSLPPPEHAEHGAPPGPEHK